MPRPSRPRRGTLAIATFAAIGIACGSLPTPRFANGSDAALTADGLRLVERAGFQRVWVKPGVSFQDYDQIWLRYRDILYRRPPRSSHGPVYAVGGDNYALSGPLYARLSGEIRSIFEHELVDRDLRSADTKGPGVLEARIGLVDLIVHVPLDVRAGGDNLFVDSVGSVTILVDLQDSESGALIARVAERRGIATETGRPIRATASSAIYETRRLLRDWAGRLRSLLGTIRSTDLG